MNIEMRISPPIANEELGGLFVDEWGWGRQECPDFASILKHALFYVGGYVDGKLIGFAKVIWDGDEHGFLLDPTVSPAYRRKGIGRQIVLASASEAAKRGVRWLHVDFESHLAGFYRSCGFRTTDAGLINLHEGIPTKSAQAIP